MRIDNQGIEIEVPSGWEAAISGDRTKVASLPVVHLSTTALGPDRGDFGSGAVEDLGEDDAFVAIVEYGEDRGAPYVELEVRQDLIADDAGQKLWAERLARVLRVAASRVRS